MSDIGHAPIVSIISLTYNHAPYIRECLEGFLMQKTDFPFEVIIHDDASTDGTTDIIREYAAKYPDIIKPIIQTENQYSKHHDFNKILQVCFDRSQGKYIALCEGDDYWTAPFKLQKQFNILQSNENISLTFHNAKVIKLRSGAEQVFVNSLRQGIIPYWKLILSHWCTPTASFFFRSSCIVGQPPTNINGDMFVLFSCGAKGDVYFLNEILSVYRSGTPGGASDVIYKSSHIPMYEKKIALMRFINRITNNRYIIPTSIKSIWCQIKLIKCKLFRQ